MSEKNQKKKNGTNNRKKGGLKKFRKAAAHFPMRMFICALLILLELVVAVNLVFLLDEWFYFASFLVVALGIAVVFNVINKDEPAAYKLPWGILLSILPVPGVIIYLIFGNPQQSRRVRKRFNQVNKEAAEYLVEQDGLHEKMVEACPDGASLANYLSATTKMPPYENTSSEYFPSGEAFFDSLKNDLKMAKNYVFMEYFIITPGKMWGEIYDILKQKIIEGVKVYVLYDDIGSMKKTPTDFDTLLRAEGFSAYKFNPITPIATTVHNNRDHRKITVIDGKIAYTGGVNIADEYINEISLYGKWKDSAIKLTGESVDSFVFMFTQLYNIFAKEPIDPALFLTRHKTEKCDGFVQPYGDGPRPMDNDYTGKNLYLGIINAAKKYLYIATPYLIMGYEAEEALCVAAKRGVDVIVMTPHVPDKKSVFIMTRSVYKKLIDAGVKVYEYGPGFIHSKIILADDSLGVIGTVNFDYRSFVHHYECGAFLVKTSSLLKIKKDYLNTVESNGILQTPESARLTLAEKLVKNVIGVIAPML